MEIRSASDNGIRELDITLIHPTNYTDDGYPITTRVGVIRSNTLMQMEALVREAMHAPFFLGVRLSLRKVEEAAAWIPVSTIVNRSRLDGVKSIVMLVGVQTNQFPRALDIAARFLPHRIPVLLGGFHVSGMLAMIGETDDLRDAMARGITLVAGEVEGGRVAELLQDAVLGTQRTLYNFLHPVPSLKHTPMPRLTRTDVDAFTPRAATIDTGRGCVFNCDFRTIVNVQGRVMRNRDPAQVVDFVRSCYRDAGITHTFFTDDNLARNPAWRELFTSLIRLREEEHAPITFMMQSDLAARRMPGGDFFALAARAGCREIFFGIESINPENLRSQGKHQNSVDDFAGLVSHCHALGIACHAGYILGLPFDTPESIRRDITGLQRMMFDSASFYILAPLPGSRDHQRWRQEGRWMAADFNAYDSAHVAVAPERMSCEELTQSYRDAWEQFYSTAHMAEVLRMWKHDQAIYRERLGFFMWYLYTSRVEGLHPMNCGFWSVRHRRDRRSGMPRERLPAFRRHQAARLVRRVAGICGLFFQMEEVWLRSRPRSGIEERLSEIIARTKRDVLDWRGLTARELRACYTALRAEIPGLRVPSAVRLWMRKRNPFAGGFTRTYAERAWRRWYRHVWNPLKLIELWLFEWTTGFRFLRDLFGGRSAVVSEKFSVMIHSE